MLYIEFARRRRHWTQHQLAQFTRIVASFICVIEKGQGIPNADQLDRLARALDVPAELLLKEVVTELDTVRETEHASA